LVLRPARFDSVRAPFNIVTGITKRRALDSVAATPADANRRRIEADQIDAMYRGSSTGLLASLIAGIILYVLLTRHGHVSATAMNIWIGIMTVQVFTRVGIVQYYERLSPPPKQRPFWGRLFTLGAFVGGLSWGIGSLYMVTPAEFDIQLMVVLVISALVYASLSGFGSYLPFYAFLFPSLVPLCVWSALQPDGKHLAFALLGAVWIPVVAWLGHGHNKNVIASYNLRYENLDLLEDVRRQKERAEEANIAKSRFLASASHDLRQPVHALGMFVGALKAQEMSPTARRLVDHIEGSVGGLDGLFAALLDISRLDAGVIAASRHTFALQPLLRRVCRDLQVQALQKGLMLDWIYTSALAQSDPVLLERIIRNIVTNAVRHTDKGRILVGCRRGAKLRIQVWDTGPGIAADQQDRIFEEFFQLTNPGRDRSQGLGLGLAIVRRLTRLLGHPLRLRSAPGRGAMFEVEVPSGVQEDLPASSASMKSLAVNGLVLVIDDEAAICEAMRSLLESWGHTVITAHSGAAMLDAIADCPRRPDLIICDYRLQNGENGIKVIQRLQSEFNDEIPAMLVTGDTAPDRLLEARASGYLLLHKPIAAERLRQAMESLTAEPA
jgi:signal transduction histidine kinase/CheY-like chemotaxis protein